MHITMFDDVRELKPDILSPSPSHFEDYNQLQDLLAIIGLHILCTHHQPTLYLLVFPANHCTCRSRSLFVRPQLSCLAPKVRISLNTSLRPTSTARRIPLTYPVTVALANPSKMAAAIKALNAKIRSNKYSDYFCSTRMFYPSPHPQRTKRRSLGEGRSTQRGVQRILQCENISGGQWTDNC
jgi:hypothetical protein